MTQAYPLQWPAGWPRMSAHGRKRAKFGVKKQMKSAYSDYVYSQKSDLSIADGRDRIIAELATMGVRDGQWVISTNLELRNDGLPRSSQRQPEDPGVAVYWTRKGKQQVMAIDLYDRVADNLAAIAASLSALRAIERHGGAQILDRAFEGFTALAAPDHFDAYAVFGLKREQGPFNRDHINRRFRELAQSHHPDVGGQDDRMADLNRARAALLAEAI